MNREFLEGVSLLYNIKVYCDINSGLFTVKDIDLLLYQSYDLNDCIDYITEVII